MPVMKTTLEHLPSAKQTDLARIVERVREAEEVEMIILFGSHARGDWVEDTQRVGNAVFEYASDFDIYVLTRLAKTAKRLEYNRRLRERFFVMRTPVSLIADTVKHFNASLERGRYFYVDIVKEGIVLFDSGRYTLSEPKELTRQEQCEEARQHFDYWYRRSSAFFETRDFHVEKGEMELAAFDLHQAAEHATTAALLVLSNYKPKGHDLEERLKKCALYDDRFATIIPAETAEEERLFKLLCEAYIGARYVPHFRVAREEVEAIVIHVRALCDLAREACESRIRYLGGDVHERAKPA